MTGCFTRFNGAIRGFTLLAAALGALAVAAPADAQLTLSINNRTCAVLDVNLADAPGCAPGVPGCSVSAPNGFTAKLMVRQPYHEGYLRLTAEGECPARNTRLSGTCLVEIKTVRQRLGTFGVYRDPRDYSQSQSVGPPYDSPFHDLELSLPAPATLVTVEIYQGICERTGGGRVCELTCRSSDQQ